MSCEPCGQSPTIQDLWRNSFLFHFGFGFAGVGVVSPRVSEYRNHDVRRSVTRIVFASQHVASEKNSYATGEFVPKIVSGTIVWSIRLILVSSRPRSRLRLPALVCQMFFRRAIKPAFTEWWMSFGKPRGSCFSTKLIAVSAACETSVSTSLASDAGKPARSAD